MRLPAAMASLWRIPPGTILQSTLPAFRSSSLSISIYLHPGSSPLCPFPQATGAAADLRAPPIPYHPSPPYLSPGGPGEGYDPAQTNRGAGDGFGELGGAPSAIMEFGGRSMMGGVGPSQVWQDLTRSPKI
jgi:hypothetical protein